MKKINSSIHGLAALAIASFFIMASCEEELIGSEIPNTPTNTFNYFWKIFDTHYGLFEVKNINWNAIHEQFSPQVNDQMSDEELYTVLGGMMVQLNDNHLNLYPTNGTLEAFPGGILRYKNGTLTILKVQEDYDLDVVKKYLMEFHEVSTAIQYGWLEGNIGYINISNHEGSQKQVEADMEQVMVALKEAKALIVDVRGDYGGMDAIAQLMAGHFASSEKLYMTSRKRNGPAHTDFTEPVTWYAQPTGTTFTGTVVLLTSRFTQSAGETFTLAMKEFEHVTVVGDTTAGSYSDNPNFDLPNGWIISISVGDYRAADGKSYEGIGTAPHVWTVTTQEDLLAEKDPTLEKAIDIVK